MLHVVHETMIDTAIETRAVAADVSAARATVAGQAHTLFAGGWSGPAASGFQTALTEWDAGAAKVIHALDTMGELIGRAGRGFAATDTRDSAALRSAGSGLSSGLNL